MAFIPILGTSLINHKLALWRVVTDLDHTLLSTPSEATEAGRVIRELSSQGFTTTLASSKTFSEMIHFYEEAGLVPSPFIFENGCGIGWPLADLPPSLDAQVALKQHGFGAILLGSALASAIEILFARRKKDGFQFSLIGELDPSELARLTGLDPEAGRKASERLASVPILWRDSAEKLKELVDELSVQNLMLVSGGTFSHVSPRCDKYSAFLKILEWQNECRASWRIVACGDSENDLSLLSNADHALLFSANPNSPLIPQIERPIDPMNQSCGKFAQLSPGKIEGAGPLVWLRAVEAALRSPEHE